MNTFYYKIVDKNGKILKGKIIAGSEKEVLEYLSSLGFVVLQIKEAKTNILTRFLQSFERFSVKDKIFIARNISIILKSGASLGDALKILVTSIKRRKIRDFFLILIYNIEKGSPFHSTFEYFKHGFTPVEVELIKVGEISGNLARTFDKLSEDLEKEQNIRSEIISALIYPVIVLIAAFGVVILVTTVVLPKIAELVKEMNTKLPLFSRVILDVGVWIGGHLKLVISIILAFVILMILLFTTRRGRNILLFIALKTPVLKNLILNMNLRSFCFLMRSLIESGINISQAMYLTSTVINHPQLKLALINIHKGVQAGGSLSVLINNEKVFPELLAGLLTIGYETGALPSVLGLMEEFYEDEVRYSIKTLMTLLEPILIMFVGIIVGLVAVSIVVPVYQQISTQLEQGMKGRGGGF